MSSSPKSGDTLYKLVWRLCENLAGLITASGGGSMSVDINPVSSLNSIPDIQTVAATAVQFPSKECKRGVILVACSKNKGSVFIGGSNVSDFGGVEIGLELLPGGISPMIIPCSNTNQLFVNASTTGDRVGVIVL